MNNLGESRLGLIWHARLAWEGRGRLAKALRGEGVELVDDSADRELPGLLPLADGGERSLEAVVRLSRGGQRRLVVALAPHLAAGPPLGWQLLALGASEVLSLATLEREAG